MVYHLDMFIYTEDEAIPYMMHISFISTLGNITFKTRTDISKCKKLLSERQICYSDLATDSARYSKLSDPEISAER
jgi:hypothetical protein